MATTILADARPIQVPEPRRRGTPPKPQTLSNVIEAAFDKPPGLGEFEGVKIVREEQVMNLPKAPFKGFVKVILADNREMFRCTTCGHIAERGPIIAHRMKEHGQASAQSAKRRAEQNRKTPAEVLDPEVANLTVAEVLQFAADRAGVASMLEDLTNQRDEWKSRAMAAEMAERRIAAALDRAGFRRIDEEVL